MSVREHSDSFLQRDTVSKHQVSDSYEGAHVQVVTLKFLIYL